MPPGVMMTISPGSTSRTKRAPMMSSAQVSEARIGAPSRSPSTSGRMPSGSRQPIIFFDDRQTSDQAPSISDSASMNAVDQPRAAAGGDEVEDHLGVGGRLEDRAALLQPLLHGHGIGDVAVVGDGEAAAGELGEERLDVAIARAARGRVAGVADRAVARQPVDHRAAG